MYIGHQEEDFLDLVLGMGWVGESEGKRPKAKKHRTKKHPIGFAPPVPPKNKKKVTT